MADNHEHEHEGFGPDYVTIVDEEGKSYEMEFLETVELDGKTYMAFCEADLPDDEQAVEVTIFRLEKTDDGEELVGVDDEEELEKAYEAFMELMEEDSDEE